MYVQLCIIKWFGSISMLRDKFKVYIERIIVVILCQWAAWFNENV